MNTRERPKLSGWALATAYGVALGAAAMFIALNALGVIVP